MSGPGQGRYTAYVPAASARNEKLSRLFNGNAGDKGVIYGKAYQTEQKDAAAAAVNAATAKVDGTGRGGVMPSDGVQAGDVNMFPTGVNLSFSNAPNLSDVAWKNPGDPANPYTPDLSSPGPGKTSPLDKGKDPKIAVADVKGETYIPGAPGTGTSSPSTTSTNVGASPIGKALVMGKSSV